MQFQTRHIQKIIKHATLSEFHRGITWYPRAYKWCALVGRKYNVRADTVAGVLAALSPQTSWAYNLRIAREFVASGGATQKQTKNNLAKARRILAGEDPLAVLKGAKVRHFYGSIVGFPGALCLDRHAYSLACGRVLKEHEVARAFRGKKLQLRAWNAYERAAIIYGLELRELQAITWLTWRRIKKLN